MEHYDVGRVLGEGTFGIVYDAIQLSTKNHVAIKQFKKDKFKDGVNFTALREIKLQMEIHHENVTALLDAFVHDDTVNLVFEYLPHNLEDLIQSKEMLSPGDIKSYLQYVVQNGIF